MAFSSTINRKVKGGHGSINFHYGTATLGDPGSTRTHGRVSTGLSRVDDFSIIPFGTDMVNLLSGTVVVSGFLVGNATGDVSVITNMVSGTTAYWSASGI